MGLAVILIGAMFVISAIRNEQGQLAAQFESDLPGYLVWGGALTGVWLLGKIPGFQKPAILLMALVLLVIVIADRGVFANLQQAIQSPPASTSNPEPPLPAGNPTITVATSGGGSGASGAGGIFSSLLPILGAVAAPFTGGASLAVAGVADAAVNASGSGGSGMP